MTIDFHLYLITDRRKVAGGDLVAALERACRAGVKAIQLREKDLNTREIFELAQRIQAVCQACGTQFFINERSDLARALNADGIQLTSRGLPVSEVRRILKPNQRIGVSTHSPDEAISAERDGADFILFGPVFSTQSKMTFGSPQGLSKLEEVTSLVKVPVFAVGGVTPETAAACTERGAHGVAVISSVLSCADLEESLRKFRKKLGDF